LLVGSALHAQDVTLDSAVTILADSTYSSDESDGDYGEGVSLSPDSLHSAKEYQQEKLTIRKFDQEKWKKIIGKTDYSEKQEEKEEEKERPDLSRAIPWANNFLRVLGYLLIFAIAALIFYYIVKNSSMDSGNLKVKPSVQHVTTTVDDIENIDFNSWLANALKDGNLRLVIRIHFLSLLRGLHDSGQIKWKKHKTNSDYLLELLNDNVLFSEVRKLTLAYEAIWYGELALTTENYANLVAGFEKANSQLKPPTEL
jgi:hypothetical protein